MKLQKKIVALLLLLFGSIPSDVSANDTTRIHTIVLKKAYYQPLVLKTSPTAFLWGGVFPFTSEYRFMVEITSGRTQSEQVSISVLGKNIFLSAAAALTNENIKVNGWRIQYAHKFYLIGRKKFAPYGFYVAPLVSYSNARISIGLSNYYNKTYLDFRHFNINAIAGIQVGKIHRVTLDAYCGLGYRKNKVDYHYSSNKIVPYDTKEFGELYNLPLNAVFGINLGYSL